MFDYPFFFEKYFWIKDILSIILHIIITGNSLKEKELLTQIQIVIWNTFT